MTRGCREFISMCARDGNWRRRVVHNNGSDQHLYVSLHSVMMINSSQRTMGKALVMATGGDAKSTTDRMINDQLCTALFATSFSVQASDGPLRGFPARTINEMTLSN